MNFEYFEGTEKRSEETADVQSGIPFPARRADTSSCKPHAASGIEFMNHLFSYGSRVTILTFLLEMNSTTEHRHFTARSAQFSL